TLARPTTASELEERAAKLAEHASKLEALAAGSAGRFDATAARDIADRLLEAARASAELDDEGRALLRGAMDYFMLIEDEEPDLRPGGFDDDRAVADAVLAAIKR